MYMQTIGIHSIEDCLEVLTGLQKHNLEFQINSSEETIFNSIARQVFKGTALTDRQYNLMKEKLSNYSTQFEAQGVIGFERALNRLRNPIREIDRSRWIKIVDHPGNNVYQSSDEGLWIAVKFIFSKKLIQKFEPIKKEIKNHFYDSDKKIHYFKLNEHSVYQIVSAVQNSDFEIEPALNQYYEKLVEMKNNKETYIPGIYNYKLKNLNKKSIDYMINTIGEPCKDNLALYKDRQQQLGLHYFDEDALEQSISQLTVLASKIVKRTKKSVQIKPSEYNFNNLAESILELERFPLLVVLTETSALEELHTVHNSLKGFISDTECSVMFRLDNEKNYNFNNYIKTHNLNSSVDENTKVVYISNSKIPKPLVKSNWKSNTVLLMSSIKSMISSDAYINESDLIIHYDDNMSQYLRFQKDGIEKL